jgi:hypothetical protein
MYLAIVTIHVTCIFSAGHVNLVYIVEINFT